MSSFNDFFGGSTVNPANLSFAEYDLAADSLTLEWPGDGLVTANAVVDIIRLSPENAGRSVTLPDATKGSRGASILFYNRGSQSVTLLDYDGNTLATIEASDAIYVILRSVTTTAGAWDVMDYGAVTSAAQASQLASSSIAALGSVLVQSWPVSIRSTDYTAGVADRGNGLVWAGGSGQIILPPSEDVGGGWFFGLRNAGSGTLTLALDSNVDFLDGVENGTATFEPGESAIILCTGDEFYLLCKTASAEGTFTYLEIDVSGTGDYTLSSAEQGYTAYRLSGTLTGNRNIIVPATVAQYLVNNKTTGAFTLTVKTAAGTGVTVATDAAKSLYSDGTNVVDAATSGISTPISVANGGTGASTGDNALTNLGGTSTGLAVFKAASAAAARSSLGAGGAGDDIFTAITEGAARAAMGITSIGESLFTAATQAAALSAIGAAGTSQANTWSAAQSFGYGVLQLNRHASTAALGGRLVIQPGSGSTLSGNLLIDVNSQDLRIFESGGTGRGAFLPLASQAAAAASEIWTSASFPKATTSLPDFSEAVDDRVDALIANLYGIEKTYDDGTGAITLTRRSTQLDIDIAGGGETWLGFVNISQLYDRLDIYLTDISTNINGTITFGYSTNNGGSYTFIPMGNVVAANSVGGRITIERYSSANGQQKHITILWEEGGVVKVTRHTGTGINGVQIQVSGGLTFDAGGAITAVAS